MSIDRADQVMYDSAILAWPQRLMNAGIELLSGATTRKGLVTLADQAVASATNFLTGIIIGRTLAKEEFGLYMLGFSIVLLIVNVQTSLISTPYTIYGPRLKGNAHAQYTGSTLVHQLGLSVLSIGCLIIVGFVISFDIGPSGLAPVVWALAVVISFILMREYARAICFAHLWMTSALLLDLGVAAVQIGGLLLLAHAGSLSPSTAYWIVGLSCGLPAIGWLVSMKKHFVLRLPDVTFHLKRNWSFARWLFAGTLTYSASQQIYPWLLTGFHGTAANGVLSACMGVLFLANPFLIGMGNFLGPKTAHAFANGGVRELHRIVNKATIFFAITMGIFCVIMICFGGWLVGFLYGNKYAGNGLTVGVLAFSQLAAALTFPTNYALNAVERPDVGFNSYLLALGVTLTLGLWLVKSFGTVGVACGLLSGNVVASAFRYIVFRRQLRILFARVGNGL